MLSNSQDMHIVRQRGYLRIPSIARRLYKAMYQNNNDVDTAPYNSRCANTPYNNCCVVLIPGSFPTCTIRIDQMYHASGTPRKWQPQCHHALSIRTDVVTDDKSVCSPPTHHQETLIKALECWSCHTSRMTSQGGACCSPYHLHPEILSGFMLEWYTL